MLLVAGLIVQVIVTYPYSSLSSSTATPTASGSVMTYCFQNRVVVKYRVSARSTTDVTNSSYLGGESFRTIYFLLLGGQIASKKLQRDKSGAICAFGLHCIDSSSSKRAQDHLGFETQLTALPCYGSVFHG